jgi:IS4 transposase
MLTKAPFLSGFPTILFGSVKRKMQDILQSERKAIEERCPGGLSRQLAEEIPADMISRHSSSKRDRVYPHGVTFRAFLSQVLCEDGSCARAVAGVQQWMRERGQAVPSSETTAYVKARQALPETMLKSIHGELFSKLEQNLPSDQLWRGHRVKAIDATSVQMPDTVANQATFPQPSSQAVGCGFPVVQLIGLIDLGHGGFQDFATSTMTTGEMRGFDKLEEHLGEGDVLVADRLYSSYEVVARLRGRKVEFIGRNNQARKLDFRKGKKLGPNERIQTWNKPPKSVWCQLSKEQWEELPEEMEMRIIRTKGPDREGKQRVRYVVTTLLDSEAYPAEEVASLYVHRWEIELLFRDIKTTMGMEMLRTKSPQMALKEVMMHMIAYNAVRLLMLKAAAAYHCSHRRIGFKAVLQVLEACRSAFEKVLGKPQLLSREKDNLLERIAERAEPERPGRNEPRKKKRRPKSYGWLQRPRHSYFEYFRSENPPMKILDDAA